MPFAGELAGFRPRYELGNSARELRLRNDVLRATSKLGRPSLEPKPATRWTGQAKDVGVPE